MKKYSSRLGSALLVLVFGSVTTLAVAETLAPTAQAVLLGKVIQGNLASLAAEDGNAEYFRKFLIPNIASPFVSVRLTYVTSILNPSSLQLAVKARYGTPGGLAIRLFQTDLSTGIDVETMPESPLHALLTEYIGTATGDLSRFVDQTTAKTTARFTVRQTGPVAAVPIIIVENANQVVLD